MQIENPTWASLDLGFLIMWPSSRTQYSHVRPEAQSASERSVSYDMTTTSASAAAACTCPALAPDCSTVMTPQQATSSTWQLDSSGTKTSMHSRACDLRVDLDGSTTLRTAWYSEARMRTHLQLPACAREPLVLHSGQGGRADEAGHLVGPVGHQRGGAHHQGRPMGQPLSPGLHMRSCTGHTPADEATMQLTGRSEAHAGALSRWAGECGAGRGPKGMQQVVVKLRWPGLKVLPLGDCAHAPAPIL